LVVHHLDVERDAVGMAGLRQQPPGRRGIGGRQVRIGEAEMIRRQQPPGGPREIVARPLRQLGPVHRECHGAPHARIVERRARDVRMQPAELGRRDGIHRHVGVPARPIDPGLVRWPLADIELAGLIWARASSASADRRVREVRFISAPGW
jgi:hypothetical protein